MEFLIPYGKGNLSFYLPDSNPVDIIKPRKISAHPAPEQATLEALDQPQGRFRWADFANANSVAIAINDKTRPVPHQYLLPPLLARLSSLGIPDGAIKLFIAVGTHPPMSKAEFSSVLPDEILARYDAVSHNSEDPSVLEYLGETERGTPVWSNRDFVDADFKIVVGNIEPHQFVGFSGGVKSAAIGLSGLQTINKNHALMSHPDSQLGRYESNPARQDIEEIGSMIGIDLALNAVLNHDKQIVRVLAGEPVAVMKTGVPLSRQICQVKVSQEYPMMIVSPGGYPKDINVYQSQKGLGHAARVTKPGGSIILVAACQEGSGSPHYEEWMTGKDSHQEVMRKFTSDGFRIGPHKAFQIAREATQFRLMVYSDLGEKLARKLLLEPVRDIQSAIDDALLNLKPGERVGILAHATSTIPYL